MTGDLATELARTRLVCENLAMRVGQLTAENIALLLRINELEHPNPPAPVEEEVTPT